MFSRKPASEVVLWSSPWVEGQGLNVGETSTQGH